MTPRRHARIATVLLALAASTPALSADCMSPAALQPVTGMSTVTPEMVRPPAADPFCLAAADALARLRGQMAAVAPGAYVPLTKDDNTPWRFDMRQNGKQMTSVEFDAWMKAKGIRVATGRSGGAATTGVPTGAAAPLPALPAAAEAAAAPAGTP